MRTCPLYRPLVVLLAIASALTAAAQANVQNRISSAINGGSRVALAHTVSPRAARSQDLGEAPSSLELKGMTMHFSMTPTQQAALTQLLADQQNPASPRYHQWLTPEQFGAQFGLSAGDLAKVTSWLTAQGFTVTGTARSSTFVTFSGTAAQVQSAFGVPLHRLSYRGEQHIANIAEPVLPAAIAGVVSRIDGLDDFRLKPRLHRGPVQQVRTNFTTTQGGTTQHFLAPGDFATIYDTASSGLNGSGVTIAVMGQVDLSSYITSDVANFRSSFQLPSNLPTQLLDSSAPPVAATSTCLGSNPPSTCAITADDFIESLLDVEWAGAVAPQAKIVFVTSSNVITNSLIDAIDQNVAPILSISYGNCEANLSLSTINQLNLDFQQANAQGQTIFGPAGDDGATDCDDGVSQASNGLAVDFPASSPYVTGVGGTTLNDGNSSSYWNSSSSPAGSSARQYIPEIVWNETTNDLATLPAGASPSFAATGGGASLVFAKPAWQTGTGVPNDASRDVPDVALAADADHNGYLVCNFGSCNGGQINLNNSVFGGTSVAAPSFAGILALVEQHLANTGGGNASQGNINPQLYALANSAFYNNIFHDVTSGNNNSPCVTGSQDCQNGGSTGFSAGTGYDQTTGWGSVDAAVLANDWNNATPIVSGSLALSTTHISGIPSSSVNQGTSVPLTIAVASGSTATNATPTGTVQMYLDNKLIPSSQVTLNSGSATYSLNSSNICGMHNITAAYSGDGTYNSSKDVESISVTGATCPNFTLTSSASSITVKSGAAAAPITLSLGSQNGFAGVLFFQVSTTSNINAGSVNLADSVNLAAGGTATATFTFDAFNAQASSQIRLRKSAASLTHPEPPSKTPWYLAGSGTVLACLVLVSVPRRRRWGALLAAVISVSVLSAAGCGGSHSTTTAGGGGGGTGGGSTGGQTNTNPGTYPLQVTAIGYDAQGDIIANTVNISVTVQ